MAAMVASLLHTISSHTGDITGVAFTQGKLATASADKTARLWSTEDFSELPCSPLLGHSYIIHDCTFSPFGTILATCSTDGKLILWDVKSGEVKAQFEHSSKSSIRVCRFSPDSTHIISGSDDDTLCMWEIATGKLVRSFTGLEDSIVALAYSPDGHFVVSGSPNGDLHVWDASFGHGRHLFLKVDAHDLGVTCCEFSPTFGTACTASNNVSNLLLATGGKDNLLKLWNFRAKVGSADVLLQCHMVLPGHSDIVMSCAFSPAGNILASGSLDKTVRLWDPLKGELIFSMKACHSRFVTCCAFSCDGCLLATGSMDHSVKIWKLTNTSHIMDGLRGFEEPGERKEVVVAMPNPMEDWSVDKVVQWLDTIGLGQYQQVFRANAINGKELLALSSSDLHTSLGVAALDHRNKILRGRQQGEVVTLPSSAADVLLSHLSADTSTPQPSTSVANSAPCAEWTVQDVVQWLDTLGMVQYGPSFLQNAIDGVELLALTSSDLETTLGVAPLGHRNKIIRSRDPDSDILHKLLASPCRKVPGTANETADRVHEFYCPITMDIMRDPVIAADGYTYDQSAIRSWLESGKDRSPMTNAVLAHRNLTPNRTLKMLIQKHLEKEKK